MGSHFSDWIVWLFLGAVDHAYFGWVWAWIIATSGWHVILGIGRPFFQLFELKRALKQLLSFLDLLLVVPCGKSGIVLRILWKFAWLSLILGKGVPP